MQHKEGRRPRRPRPARIVGFPILLFVRMVSGAPTRLPRRATLQRWQVQLFCGNQHKEGRHPRRPRPARIVGFPILLFVRMVSGPQRSCPGGQPSNVGRFNCFAVIHLWECNIRRAGVLAGRDPQIPLGFLRRGDSPVPRGTRNTPIGPASPPTATRKDRWVPYSSICPDGFKRLNAVAQEGNHPTLAGLIVLR